MEEEKQVTIQDVIKKMKRHNKRSDAHLIERAYNVALSKHSGQVRLSGEPYITHPLEVAYILADLELDDSTICAALLHDVIEDTKMTYDDVVKEFSKEIAEIVEGVTKLSKTQNFTIDEEQVENYRKMFLAMGKDVRIILIKLADRLHNMRTLKFLPRQNQITNAKETMELYAPIANRLGIYSVKWELEDLAFRYLHPEEYREIIQSIEQKREERLKIIEDIKEELQNALKKQRIEVELEGRAKHLYSIYRKMKRDNITIDQVYDLFALRILVKTVKDCYTVLRNST